MLLKLDEIKKAMSLNTREVCEAMERGGYGCEGVRSAEFLGLSDTGSFVYSFQYRELSGEWDSGRIYIRVCENPVSGAREYVGDF